MIKVYLNEIQYGERAESVDERRYLIIMMRSLLCTPEFLQGEDTTHNAFWISASNFLDAYITEVKEREDGRQLIKDLFCDFQSYVPQCPSEYIADPTQFLSYLSKLFYESDFTVSSTRYLDTQHFDRVASIHELYANFCQVSPRFALSMAEQYPLFPSSLYYSGKSLESASFFLHFFRYQTVLTPIMIENRLSCLTATFSKDQQSLILDSQHRTMSRIHAAQIDILRTFLTASPHSRDYVLNLTAMLCEANRARRSNPNDFLSSDGLLMNLLMAILALLAPVLDESPRHPTAKKWLLYFFSDLGRVDILGADVSASATWEFPCGLRLDGRLSYTYQQAEDVTSRADSYYGDQIPYIPWHSGSAIVNVSWRGFELDYSFIYTGERYDATENISQNYVPEWYTSDIALSYNFRISKTKMRLTAEVNNVFNQQFEVVKCYPMPGTNFKVTLKVEI